MSEIESIHIIHGTDCGDFGSVPGGLAAGKVRNAYRLHAERLALGVPSVEVIGSVPFSTIDAAAKVTDQFFTSVVPHKDADSKTRVGLGINAAPPKSPRAGTTNHGRENMVVGMMGQGRTEATIAGTIKGYSLSYLKPFIHTLFEVCNTKEVLDRLYGNLFHDGMAQFRSHYLQPRLLLDGLRFNADQKFLFHHGYDVQPVEIDSIPDPAPQTHAFTRDEFGNVKLWTSDEDSERLGEAFESAANGKEVHGSLSFSKRSVEAGAPQFPWRRIPFVITSQMFQKAGGTNVVSATSSSKIGGRVLPQLCTIQTLERPGTNYALPEIGAAVQIELEKSRTLYFLRRLTR